MSVLREQLLAGRTIAVGGGAGEVVRRPLAALGARVVTLPDPAELDGGEDPGGWARSQAPLHALIYGGARSGDGSGAWSRDESGDEEGQLLVALERCWVAVREVATGALIPAEGPSKVLLVGPAPAAGAMAGPARAALENLARTLSVEWARYGITTTMIAPGPRTTTGELAELACFLVSEAGAYFSGCRLELGATAD